jgi:periodic tryptophan protein 2
LKVNEKSEYVVNEKDVELMTSFERDAPKGRFLLEKKSQFQIQGSSKITSADLQESAQAGILVVGQSNGVFSVYNLDNLQPIQSF